MWRTSIVIPGLGALTWSNPYRRCVAGGAKVGVNAFVINHDVPAHATAVGTPARIVKRGDIRVNEELPPSVLPPGAVEVVDLRIWRSRYPLWRR